jgi:AsmA-like C-terminal region/Protein of unknown function
MIHRIVKNTKTSGTYIAVEKTGRAIASYIPKTVELHQMRTPVRRMLIMTVELLVGMLVLGAVVLGAFYYKLEKGAIDLNFVVPSIESAINEQLTDLSVKIDSAFVGKNSHSAGVHFRLRNIVLFNKQGEAIANAPLAAVDLNGRALMWGRIAPSQVVFIKPTLDIAYNEGKGLSLSYAPSNGADDVIADLLKQAGQGQNGNAGSPAILPTVQKIEIMKAVTAAFEEARAHRNTTSYLTQFGVRDATVHFSRGGERYSWTMPDFIIDLKHSEKGSIIRGFGKFGIGQQDENITPWKLRFQTRQFEDSKDLQLDVAFNDITPTSLRRLLPELVKLKLFNIPFSGKVNAKLNSLGELQSAFASIHLAAGRIVIPWLDKAEDGMDDIGFDIGEVKLAYSRKGNKLHILPSPFKWGNNRSILSGVIEAVTSNSSSQTWKFAFKGSETRLAADDMGLGPMIIDEWWVSGYFNPDSDEVKIAGFFLKAGNATFTMKGRIESVSTSPGVFLQGKISSVSIPVLKRLWPSFLAIQARNWMGKSVQEGKVVAGDFKIAIPSGILDKLPDHADLLPEMVALKLDLRDLLIEYLPGFVPLSIPDATVRVAGRQLSIDVPKGRIYFRRGSALKLSHGSYTISDMRKKVPDSDLNFRVAGEAQDLLKFIDQPALKFARNSGIAANKIDGKLKGVISVHIPLKKHLEFKDVALNGNLRLRDMKSKNLFGDVSVDGGTINIKISEKAVGANGGIVLKGIPVKLNWQHIFGARKLQQPPIRLSAVLGKSSRDHLGLGAINKIVKGDIPVVVTVAPQGNSQNAIQVRADLTNASIDNTAVGWSKAPGIAAVLQFDVENVRANQTQLRNFNLVGNGLMLEGMLSLNNKTARIDSFIFPRASFKLIENMSLEGKRQDNGVMSITAKVQRLHGTKLLRLQFFDKNKRNISKADARGDYDLSAQINTVVGSNGTYVSGSRLDIQQRNGKVVWLDFKGRLNGQSSIALLMEPESNGRRTLKAESTDAGATFRIIGLYPNIKGGQLSLKVDMDPKGSTEKKGTLWVKDFYVVGSQKIDGKAKSSDIFKNDLMGERRTRTRKKRGRARVMRTRMQFNQLKAPFSFGDGQFILHDSYVNGPVIGATLRGKIDFRTERMRLGGTYIPLYGLNSAIGEIPVLSDLLVGRQGEGVFGVTFAIEGPTDKPTVIVNPVSLLAPGVFRQIFDFNNSIQDRQFRKLPKKQRRNKRKRSSRNSGTYP